jgi:hypothetical protein
MEFTHQTFTIDLTQDHHDDLQHIVALKYDIEEYLIAFEATNDKGEAKPHFHFIVFTTYKNCTNLQQHLVKKYNLSNTSGQHGGKRRYARLKQPIHNLEQLKVYCSKEGNVKSSYSPDTLTDLYRKSFKKNDRALKLKCQAFVEAATQSQLHVSIEDIRLYIIEWCMEEKVHLRRTLIDSYLIWICQNTEFSRLRKDKHQLYILLFN